MELNNNAALLNNDLPFPIEAEDGLDCTQPVDNNASSIIVTSASSSHQLNIECSYLYPAALVTFELSHCSISLCSRPSMSS